MFKIEWDQDVEVLTKALWLVDDDLSDGAQEHVFLLWLRVLDHFEYLFQEEFGVAD